MNQSTTPESGFEPEFGPGECVELVRTTDPNTPVQPGTRGTVKRVAPGRTDVEWDDGPTTAVLHYEGDAIKRAWWSCIIEPANDLFTALEGDEFVTACSGCGDVTDAPENDRGVSLDEYNAWTAHHGGGHCAPGGDTEAQAPAPGASGTPEGNGRPHVGLGGVG